MFKVFWVGVRGSLSLVKKENYLPLVLRKSDIFRLECNKDKEEIVMHYHEHPANPVNRMRNYAKSEDIIDIRCDKNRQSVKFVCLFHTKDDAIETMKFLFNLEEIDGKPGTALSTLLDRTSY